MTTAVAETVEIVPVRSAADAAAVADMVWEFFGWLQDAYPAQRAEVRRYLDHYDVAGELAALPERFTPPAGECLIARLDGAPVGTLMLKRVDAALCELNRMYVRPEGRGRGIARALCERLMDAARAMGFREIRLETLNPDIPALPLYRALGFLPDPTPTAYAAADPRIVSLRRPL